MLARAHLAPPPSAPRLADWRKRSGLAVAATFLVAAGGTAAGNLWEPSDPAASMCIEGTDFSSYGTEPLAENVDQTGAIAARREAWDRAGNSSVTPDTPLISCVRATGYVVAFTADQNMSPREECSNVALQEKPEP